MTEHSSSDTLGHEVLKAVMERSTPAESLEERLKAVESVLATAERLGIRDDTLDEQAHSVLVDGLKAMSRARRWHLPWKSKRHDSRQLPVQQAPRALPPGPPDSG